MSTTLTTTRVLSSPLSVTKPGRLALSEDELPGLDPEWRRLWNEHGSQLDRADEVTIEEYRAAPAKYSFTYANCEGE